MPVAMRVVARRAGVSACRRVGEDRLDVVNGYPFIRESTRDRVLGAIDALGYQPNLNARTLRAGRTDIIALAVPELSLPYFAELADAVINAAEKHGLTVLIEQTNAVRERELAALSSTRAHLVDGLLFSPLAPVPPRDRRRGDDATAEVRAKTRRHTSPGSPEGARPERHPGARRRRVARRLAALLAGTWRGRTTLAYDLTRGRWFALLSSGTSALWVGVETVLAGRRQRDRRSIADGGSTRGRQRLAVSV